MATWKDWFKVAKEKNIPLQNYLTINQPKDLERLHNSGLPFYDFIILNGRDFKKEEENIKEFSKKHKQMWIRVIGSEGRHYKLDIRGYEQLIEFISSLKINIENYQLQLFEYHENIFGGNIIVNDEEIYIELAEGTQERVSRNFLADLIIYKGRINKNGRLTFFEREVPGKIRRIANRMLKFIKIDRTNYLKGYFEFAVSQEGEVFFLDYKTSIK
jgi:L-rhamnose mutarotase